MIDDPSFDPADKEVAGEESRREVRVRMAENFMFGDRQSFVLWGRRKSCRQLY